MPRYGSRIMDTLPRIVVDRTAALPRKLAAHTARVRTLARKLAERHGVDVDASELGAVCHDLARHIEPAPLLEQAEELGISVDHVQRRAPVMLHGPIAAAWLERDGEISDTRVIDAVRYHTTGSPDMCPVSKIVFLADKLEPQKVKRRPRLAEVLHLAAVDIDIALLEYLNREIVRRVKRSNLLHPSTLALRNHLVMNLPENDLLTGRDAFMDDRDRRLW